MASAGQLELKGRFFGWQEGRQEGVNEGHNEIAGKMMPKGLNRAAVMQVTLLGDAEHNALANAEA